MSTGIAASYILMLIILPAWILAGFADYVCHRASQIEQNAGFKESALHMVQLSLVGIPVVAGLFLEITRALLVIMALAILLHHAVAYWDVRYANSLREVRPVEQMVHSFLELLPITAFVLLCAVHWRQLADPDSAGFQLRAVPLPVTYVVSLLGATALFNILPYLEELWRTWWHAQGRSSKRP